jgi:hypothetical protein
MYLKIRLYEARVINNEFYSFLSCKNDSVRAFQTNIVCRYFIYGMQDEQNLERVRLTFDKFNVPMSDKQCNDGYLKVRICVISFQRSSKIESTFNPPPPKAG